ncbi:LIV-II,branched-chain amino acid transport system 2 carrier protein BrnQ,branched-chain amino acid transport system II carrier protein,Branched-chain amino acid transport protein [Chlamydia poikilotherma]|uniref:LIV-II,branched-chain amino acid transport system 2 carrier protein BrnQ,branched-chain amino acid transport system II carrier protein,Branched-chain amino acid transport protein n=1 Tax=Chlamydia poikilotherma TaxID=1967783 RepID=A0A3B0PNI3_9CHLA|nr:branched-chain amino acid transport system II carrier protein [Chlamydia poikilotherma]SYX09389.1 LIV-II,branched-chain amino acid transport system 2 carrier protein BrnQ,branched-chain amino acid transport system II carrier protein,Branched-chain amino acid transport protein [Chlamydia poikilotherma]
MNKNASNRVSSKKELSVWSIGGSIFAMFFGAGNIVFPLALGYHYHSHPWFACFGMMLTAVCVPLLGLFSMLLYSGDYKNFFYSIGKIPGMVFIIAILCLIGPFGGIPRAIAVSHSTLASLSDSKTTLLPNLPIFSLICCVLIYLFACKLSKLIQWLGSVFFPIMLITLLWIIFKGLTIPANPSFLESANPQQAWLAGITEGFNTMDLLAAFFFCSIVLISIRQMIANGDADDETPLNFQKINKKDKRTLGLAFALAAALLGLIYLGFALCASRHAGLLTHVGKGQILGRISAIALGPNSLLTGVCVFVACLTTEIALVGIVADFLARIISSKRMTYSNAVIFTLIPSYLISILNFENISLLLLPLLQLSYPALIALTCGSIAYKLWNFRHVQALFYLTLSLTIVLRLVS